MNDQTFPPAQPVTMLVGQTEIPAPIPQAAGHFLIAMCDVLGFHNFVASCPLTTVHRAYLEMRTRVHSAQNVVGFAPNTPSPIAVLDGVVFSDTVLFWAPADGAMEILAMQLCLLVAASVTSMPLRVGIAFGECIIDQRNQIYIGQPIVDAYETEQRQQWLGGAYHQSCLNATGFMERLCYIRSAVKYPVPIKPDDTDAAPEYALDWTIMSDLFSPQGTLATLKAKEQEAPDCAKPKWRNACAFFERQR